MNSAGTDTDTAHVYFAVFGCDHPEEVTKLLGFEPTQSWVRGDPTNTTGGRRTHSRWTLQPQIGGVGDIEAQLKNLIGVLEEHAAHVKAATKRYSCEIGVAAYLYHEYNPCIGLDAEAVQRLARLGLGITVDLYFLGDKVAANEESP